MRAKLKVLEERAGIEGIDLAVINDESN
nr:MAG: hypothetical protein [Bacteriophage sp.]